MKKFPKRSRLVVGSRMFVQRAVLTYVLCVAMLGCSSDDSAELPGAGVEVELARATWDTGWFQAEVIKSLLTELGYAVNGPTTLDNVEFYEFTGQGDIDLWANGWFPLHQRYLEREDVYDRVTPIGYQVQSGALQGYLMDLKTSEDNALTNLGDLSDPEIAQLFDIDGDGRADLVGCDKGWECGRVIAHHLSTYGLEETVEQVQGDYSELMHQAVDRYRAGEPVLFYTWTPNWTIDSLKIGEDVAWLGVPYSSAPDLEQGDSHPETAVYDLAGCLENPCDLGFAANDIRVVANKGFLDENPAANTLLELVEIPLEDIAKQNVLMAGGESSDEDIAGHAAAWIAENRLTVDGWLTTALDITSRD